MITDKQAAMKSADSMESLIPFFREKVGQWYEEMIHRGVTPYIYFGFRSEAEQSRLFEVFKNGGPLAAPPGESYHNYGMAIDWVALKAIPDMPGFFDADWDNDSAYLLGNAVSHDFGLCPISKETGHLQDCRAATWQDAKRIHEQAVWPTA